jgi:hypothetical protein
MLTDQVGDVVYIRDRANGYYKVRKADATLNTKMPAIGVIIKKWNFTDCVVQLYGEIRNLYTGLTPGARYFVSPAGRPVLPTDFPNPGPGDRYRVQTLGVALDVSVLLLVPSVDMLIRVG